MGRAAGLLWASLWENEGGRGKLVILGVEVPFEASEGDLALGMMKSESA